MLGERKQLRYWMSALFLACLCCLLKGQENYSGNEWAELLSRYIERTTTEFIQVPGPNPILVPGVSGWDSRVIEAADIIKDHDTYYLYYHAVGEEGSYQLGVATADHPLGPWKKYENNPILETGPKGSWDEKHVACAYIVKEHADQYYMWYSAKGSGRDDELGRNVWEIGLATASNPLGPWKKYEKNPVLWDFGYVGGVVKHRNGKYYLYTAHVIGSVGPDYSPMALAIADKPEGPYIRHEGNPVLKEGPWGSWDDGGYSEAEVYYHDGIFHMFYGGTKLHPTRILSRESIGYAYSFDGIHFTKHPKNPVAVREMQPDGGAFAEVHAYQEGSLIYLFHTLRYNSRHGDEDIGVQVLATQRPFKVRMPILVIDRLAPGASTLLDDCSPLCLDHITQATLTVRCEYDAGSSRPVMVHVKTSYDGLVYDTVDAHTLEVKNLPGQQVQQTFEIHPNVRYIKVEVENRNTVTVRNVSVYATLGG
jgi:predicted GH43/DUF377 family glycosyl hydrolase